MTDRLRLAYTCTFCSRTGSVHVSVDALLKDWITAVAVDHRKVSPCCHKKHLRITSSEFAGLPRHWAVAEERA